MHAGQCRGNGWRNKSKEISSPAAESLGITSRAHRFDDADAEPRWASWRNLNSPRMLSRRNGLDGLAGEEAMIA